MSDELVQLHRFILQHFDLEEIRTLCFELGVVYDDLRGEGRSGRVRELLLKLGRERQLERLLEALTRARPEPWRLANFGDQASLLPKLYPQLPSLAAVAATDTRPRPFPISATGAVLLLIGVIAVFAIIFLLTQGRDTADADARPTVPVVSEPVVDDFEGSWFNQDAAATVDDLFGLVIEKTGTGRASISVLVFHSSGGARELGQGQALLTSGQLVSEDLFFFDSVNRIVRIVLTPTAARQMTAEVTRCAVGQLGPPDCEDLTYTLEQP